MAIPRTTNTRCTQQVNTNEQETWEAPQRKIFDANTKRNITLKLQTIENRKKSMPSRCTQDDTLTQPAMEKMHRNLKNKNEEIKANQKKLPTAPIEIRQCIEDLDV